MNREAPKTAEIIGNPENRISVTFERNETAVNANPDRPKER